MPATNTIELPPVIAIDPGPEKSAILCCSPDGTPSRCHWSDNSVVLQMMRCHIGNEDRIGRQELVIEWVACYGRRVGGETFDTCFWAGRFAEAYSGPHTLLTSPQMRRELCHDPHAKDSDVRAKLLDLYGPGRDKAIGKRKSHGPLYELAYPGVKGATGHLWSALAVAVAWRQIEERRCSKPDQSAAVADSAGGSSVRPPAPREKVFVYCGSCGAVFFAVEEKSDDECPRCNDLGSLSQRFTRETLIDGVTADELPEPMPAHASRET